MNTNDAAQELILASLPPLREDGDLETREIIKLLADRGYVVRGRNQIRALVSADGFESLTVWDNARKGPVTVWRRTISENSAKVK